MISHAKGVPRGIDLRRSQSEAALETRECDLGPTGDGIAGRCRNISDSGHQPYDGGPLSFFRHLAGLVDSPMALAESDRRRSCGAQLTTATTRGSGVYGRARITGVQISGGLRGSGTRATGRSERAARPSADSTLRRRAVNVELFRPIPQGYHVGTAAVRSSGRHSPTDRKAVRSRCQRGVLHQRRGAQSISSARSLYALPRWGIWWRRRAHSRWVLSRQYLIETGRAAGRRDGRNWLGRPRSGVAWADSRTSAVERMRPYPGDLGLVPRCPSRPFVSGCDWSRRERGSMRYRRI